VLRQGSFEDPELGVDAREGLELCLYDIVVALAEPVQVEHQAAKVSVGELPRRAQEPGAPTHASAVKEAWLLRRRLIGARSGIRRSWAAACLGGALRRSSGSGRVEVRRSRLCMAIAGCLWRPRRIRGGGGLVSLRLGALDVPLSSEDPQH
jgi:hypothetical protein